MKEFRMVIDCESNSEEDMVDIIKSIKNNPKYANIVFELFELTEINKVDLGLDTFFMD